MENIRAKAVYWLNLAEKHGHRGEHYQELCDYIMVADYLYQLRDSEGLRGFLKRHPDLRNNLRCEITKFCDPQPEVMS